LKVQAFQGQTLEEVLPQIRQDLGSDAVILSQKQIVVGGVGGFFGRRLIQVVAADRMPTDEQLIELEDHGFDAAIDPDDQRGREQAHELLSRFNVTDQWNPTDDEEFAAEFGPLAIASSAPVTPHSPSGVPSSGPSTLAATMTPSVAQSAANADLIPGRAADFRLATTPYASVETTVRAPAIKPAADSAYQPLELPTVSTRPIVTARPIVATPSPDVALSPAVDDPQELADRARELATRAQEALAAATRHLEQHAHRSESSYELRSPQRPAGSRRQQQVIAEARELETELTEAGVDRDVAHELLASVLNHRLPFSATQDLRTLVHECVLEQIRVDTGWKQSTGTHALAVVGRTGVGKSSAVAKIAESYMFQTSCRVGIISILAPGDTIGGHGRTADPLLNRSHLDIRFVSNARQMADEVARLQDLDLLLIDTPGSTYNDAATFRLVSQCLTTAGITDVHVALPLGLSDREVQRTLERFAELGATSLLPTKVDENEDVGPVLSLCFRSQLPIRFLSDGPRIPEDIRAASSHEIASLILPCQEK